MSWFSHFNKLILRNGFCLLGYECFSCFKLFKLIWNALKNRKIICWKFFGFLKDNKFWKYLKILFFSYILISNESFKNFSFSITRIYWFKSVCALFWSYYREKIFIIHLRVKRLKWIDDFSLLFSRFKLQKF